MLQHVDMGNFRETEMRMWVPGAGGQGEDLVFNGDRVSIGRVQKL